MRNMKYVGKAIGTLTLLLIMQACSKEDVKIPISELSGIQISMAEKIRSTVLSSDPDKDFATVMLIHNDAATSIANKELESGRSSRMQKVAREVILDLKKENEEIEQLLKGHQIGLAVPQFKEQVLLNIERTEKSANAQIGTGDIDRDFANFMILQNEGAMENFRLQALFGTSLPLKNFGAGIIEKRRQQNQYLKSWLLGSQNPD
ncbi:DUF305 domain-containing protein [Desertivirga arenae]|uniref:DUF305 domain-containing protein n=1 Tax=Desertivirga arenae TaxID=2810309 RepID=UPI001A95EEF9|nr:DUF305 domain-containing protein [Pedobacter sp. SYSU D00823]